MSREKSIKSLNRITSWNARFIFFSLKLIRWRTRERNGSEQKTSHKSDMKIQFFFSCCQSFNKTFIYDKGAHGCIGFREQREKKRWCEAREWGRRSACVFVFLFRPLRSLVLTWLASPRAPPQTNPEIFLYMNINFYYPLHKLRSSYNGNDDEWQHSELRI